MNETMRAWRLRYGLLLRKAGGWFLLVAGVAGLVLPVMPGIPLVAAGLVMLSADYPWARNLMRRARMWLKKFNLYWSKKVNARVAARESSSR